VVSRLDYDSIAKVYDRRYEQNEYAGLERALLEFAADARALLEVGCGTGHFIGLVTARGRAAVGLDLSARMLAQARASLPALPLVRGRAEALPFSDRRLDRVFCMNALHHFSDHRAFVAEARRVLAPGGGLMIAGLDPHTRHDHWWIYDYYDKALKDDRARYPSAATIRALLQARGFRRVETCEVQRITLRRSASEALAAGQLDKSTTSQLSILSDAEYQAGIDRVRRDIDAAQARGSVLELAIDLRLYATVGWLD